MFSVIIPTFDRCSLTLKAIESVLNQSYGDFELIVVDDGSTADYTEVKALLNANNQIYIKTENYGVSHARNVGLRVSSRPIISFLDSDDYWLSNKLEKHCEYFKANKNISVLQNNERWFRFGNEVQVPLHLKPRSGDEFLRSLKMCCVGPSSASIRRKVFEDVGYFNESLRLCEDYDYWLRTCFRFEVGLIKEILTVKVSGSHPQLTSSESAFDRFRLFSLVSFYDSHRDVLRGNIGRITKTVETIIAKANILLNGARNRGLKEDVAIYQAILDYFNNSNTSVDKSADLAKLISRLVVTLNFRPKLKKSSII